MSDVLRIQPYDLSSRPTANSPTAYATWPASSELSGEQRGEIRNKIVAISEIASCNWDDEGRLLLERRPDLVWRTDVGQQICDVVSTYLEKPLDLEIGRAG
ncbi:MAG TPA: hypothetical protein VFH06_01660 [Candidatus Saccharimonadales bacterium]|nr:hypothetical protein [Candidatus Saccharimonadales bacterium]